MLYYALIFLLVAIVAGISGSAVSRATRPGSQKFSSSYFLVLFVISLVRGRRPRA